MRSTRLAAAWKAGSEGTRQQRLDIAADPAAGPNELAAIAPDHQDPDIELIEAILSHPNVSSGIVGRYVNNRDPQIRLLVAAHPRCPSTCLEVLALDSTKPVRDTAARRRAGEVPNLPRPGANWL